MFLLIKISSLYRFYLLQLSSPTVFSLNTPHLDFPLQIRVLSIFIYSSVSRLKNTPKKNTFIWIKTILILQTGWNLKYLCSNINISVLIHLECNSRFKNITLHSNLDSPAKYLTWFPPLKPYYHFNDSSFIIYNGCIYWLLLWSKIECY